METSVARKSTRNIDRGLYWEQKEGDQVEGYGSDERVCVYERQLQKDDNQFINGRHDVSSTAPLSCACFDQAIRSFDSMAVFGLTSIPTEFVLANSGETCEQSRPLCLSE
jgi:hypothetical protein